jgi:aryl-alcohol dehydrogenase-like predicted oxidoreductase
MTRLGSTDLDVFPLALGGNTFGWTSDEATSMAVLDAFVAGGGNLIDTADNYSIWAEGNVGGESELIIGRWIASRRNRDSVIVATKVSRHPDFRGLSRRAILGGIDASLKRLQTDHIDLYYAHYDDPGTPVEESAATFRELQVSGKIRQIALSNYTGERLQEWVTVATRNGWPLPAVFQPHYNLVHREPFESDQAPVAAAAGMSIVPYFALASGFLSGKYRTNADLQSTDRSRRFAAQYGSEQAIATVQALEAVAVEAGVSLPTVAISWLRGRPGVAAPIASARTLEQLPALLASATFTLSTEARAALDAVSAEPAAAR